MLPNPTLDQRVATGFLRCGETTNEAGIIEDEYAEIYAKDRADTVGAVWLGMTVGCATCHDPQVRSHSAERFLRSRRLLPQLHAKDHGRQSRRHAAHRIRAARTGPRQMGTADRATRRHFCGDGTPPHLRVLRLREVAGLANSRAQSPCLGIGGRCFRGSDFTADRVLSGRRRDGQEQPEAAE
ncbi:MAG: DUF1549 domain-containing protein [Ignavibacteriota bacterium]